MYENIQYTFQQFKIMAVDKIKEGTNNDSDFQKCHVKIGGFKQKLLCDEFFIDDEGNKCDFWQYVSLIKARNNLIHLYIYTEKKTSIEMAIKQSAEDYSKEDVSKSEYSKNISKKKKLIYMKKEHQNTYDCHF